MSRPSKEEYYLDIAYAVAKRGTCLRRNHGAVIVNNDQIISTGYAGAPRGTPNCIDIGKCYRDLRNIPKGKNYELCRSVHAEMNAIIHANRKEMIGAAIYIVGIENDGSFISNEFPCRMCKKMVINSGIADVVVRSAEGIKRYKVLDWITAAKNDPFKELDESAY